MKKLIAIILISFSISIYSQTEDSLNGFDQKHAWEHTLQLNTDKEKKDFFETLKRNWIKKKYKLLQPPKAMPPVPAFNMGANLKGTNGSNSVMQGVQPAGCTNIDFEQGNTSGWTVSGFSQLTTGGTDPYGGFPQVFPGGNFSLKLSSDWSTSTSGSGTYSGCFCTASSSSGNFCTSQASKVINVTPANNQLALHFAFVVLNYPHAPSDAASIELSILDQNGNQISCPYFNLYYANNQFYGLTGLSSSVGTSTTGCTGNWPTTYLPWTTVNVDLSAYNSQNVTIQMKVKWCIYNCDWAYAYIDADCGGLITNNLPPVCLGSQACAPSGYATYNWTGPGGFTSATQCFTPTTAGSYTVVCHPQISCSPSKTLTLNANSPYTVSVSSNSITCNGFGNGTATVSPQAGFGPYTYTWSNASSGSIGNAININSLTPGTYSVAVSNGSCVVTNTFAIIQPSVLTASVTNVSTVTCYSGTNGAISTSVSGGVGGYSYAWSPILSVNGTLSAIPAGNYTCIISDANSCSVSITTVVTQPTQLALSLTSNTTAVCAGNSIVLTANTTGGIGAYTYNWSNGGSASSNSVTSSSGGTYTYSVTITDANSCTITAQKTCSFIPNPIVLVDNQAMCQGRSVQLNANGASSYTWSPALGLNVTYGSAVVASPAITSIYSVIGSNQFCKSTTNVTVIVVPFPDVQITCPNQQVCDGQSTTISASGAQNYIWSPSNQVSSTSAANIVATPLATGEVTLVGYNSSGTVVCSVQKMMPLVVVPNVTPAVSQSQTICAGEKATFYASGGDTYTWSPSTGLNATNISGVVSNAASDVTYTVGISWKGACGASTVVSLYVKPSPTIQASSTSNTYNIDDQMFINAVSNGTLSWISGDEIICSICPSTQVTPKRNSCYVAQAVNNFGCKASDQVCLNITLNYGIYIPDAFTPNGDGINDEFRVAGYSISEVKMDIFDRWGEKLFSSSDITKGWDGMYNGTLCKSDAYVYKISYKGIDGKIVQKTGHVTLLK
ncbi:MAG: gliding motility-associated C-terminal domain-containing protein [Bacteroidetes bacterium]|nr:gliding motility-associated C-terminal domain-containing protein [Bacteroidota bacterium]